jgi:hypothetical protein
MQQVAHIRYQGGALLLPAHNPYDREMVFEEAEFCARRYGSVGVQVGRKEMQIRAAAAETLLPCGTCQQPIARMTFVIEGQRICGRCARKLMGFAPRGRA